MKDDFSVAVGSGRPVRIAGGDYLLGKFTPRDIGDLTAYLKEVVPDPRIRARDLCAGMPDAVALQVWRDLSEEAKDWPPSPMDARGNQILTQTSEGAARVLWVLLRRHNPGVDLDRARQLAEHVGFDELIGFINLGFPEPTFDPKSTPDPGADRGPVNP